MTKPESKLILKPGREKSVLRRHPWIFSGAVDNIQGDPKSGDVVDIISSENEFLGKGAYSQSSQMICRIWTWDHEENVDAAFIRNRLEASISRRQSLIDSEHTNAYRLVHAESDGLPGLVVDQYADVIVIQLLSWGVEVLRDEIARMLIEITGAKSVFERSDVEVRKLEGLPSRVGLVFGKDISKEIQIKENGVLYQVSVLEGQKTGFYLDQRVNRSKVRELTLDQDVLDCFSYSGGFTLNALFGGAKSVTSVDTSKDALELTRNNLKLNNLDEDAVEFVEADVFKQLRLFRDQDRKFDLIILDPPKFAFTRSQVDKASRAYKDINLLAFKLLRPRGKLVTFSCSGGISPDLFQKIVAGAALDAGVEAQVTERLYQGVDHPVALNFPEGAYLKGLVCLVG